MQFSADCAMNDASNPDFQGLQEYAVHYERAERVFAEQFDWCRQTLRGQRGHEMCDHEHPGELADRAGRGDERPQRRDLRRQGQQVDRNLQAQEDDHHPAPEDFVLMPLYAQPYPDATVDHEGNDWKSAQSFEYEKPRG